MGHCGDTSGWLGSLAYARDFACGLKRPQIGSTLWLMLFQDSRKEPIAGMNTWNRPQEIAVD